MHSQFICIGQPGFKNIDSGGGFSIGAREPPGIVK